MNGVKKVEKLGFLTREMTLGQAALKWLLDEESVVTTLPNIYDYEQLAEFAAAPDKPDLTPQQMEECTQLYLDNFGLEEEPMSYKGTMQRVSA